MAFTKNDTRPKWNTTKFKSARLIEAPRSEARLFTNAHINGDHSERTLLSLNVRSWNE
jgi:hypothetical protein